MRRVLWICNIMLPAIGKQLNLPYSNREGWLTGIFERITAEQNEKIELGVCFPTEPRKKEIELVADGVKCYGFSEDLNKPEYYDTALEQRFQEIYNDFKPEIIHIFGTEFPHALAAAKSFQNPSKTLIGIQGLCSEIAKVYMADLPEEVQKKVTFRDFIKKDSLKQQQEKFVLRGKHEIETIKLAGNITGRTRFDREKTAAVNPHAVYYSMNETMRSNFYTGEWSLSRCKKHSIFLGQGDYPLKGFHLAIEAMRILLQKYPDAMLFVAGNSIIQNKTLKEKIKQPAYGKYLLDLIQKYGLEEKVIVLGRQTAEEMKQQFLKSHVFLCPSALENSPNTIGEAMILGVPVAASFAGGIPDMIQDRKEGLLFPVGNVKKIAEAVDNLWQEEIDSEGKTLAEEVSLAGRRRAQMAHDKDNNYRRLIEIYENIGDAK